MTSTAARTLFEKIWNAHLVARGLMAGHVSPEAALGGPIAGVRDGDMIRFDVRARVLEVEISAEELKKRMATWKAPQPRYPKGVFAKYAALVSSASQGAVRGLR
jgi:dihydroxy-acid dehydratase